MKNNEATGHIYLIGTLLISLILPLLIIVLSYLNIISGLGEIIVAIAMILSGSYIIGGAVISFIQDGKDAQNEAG